MLRNALLIFVALVTLFGLYIFVVDAHHPLPLLIWGAVAFVLILGEQWRYRKKNHITHDYWQETDEQFIDPETGKATQVFYNAVTGERRYVVKDGD